MPRVCRNVCELSHSATQATARFMAPNIFFNWGVPIRNPNAANLHHQQKGFSTSRRPDSCTESSACACKAVFDVCPQHLQGAYVCMRHACVIHSCQHMADLDAIRTVIVLFFQLLPKVLVIFYHCWSFMCRTYGHLQSRKASFSLLDHFSAFQMSVMVFD